MFIFFFIFLLFWFRIIILKKKNFKTTTNVLKIVTAKIRAPVNANDYKTIFTIKERQ